MNFRDYMETRGGKALTKVEVRVLGIEYSKGWRERYADMQVTSEQLNTLIDLSTRSKTFSSKNKNRIQKFQKDL
jgi:hypothetical protein